MQTQRFFRTIPPRNAFRSTLPARVFIPMPVHEPEVAEAIVRAELRSKPVDWKHVTLQDAKDFLLAYCACFVAMIAFIS